MKTLYFSGQAAMLSKRGDEIWENLCSAMPLDNLFSVTDCVGKLNTISRLTKRTQMMYIRAVIMNVFNEQTEADPVLKRHGREYWSFT